MEVDLQRFYGVDLADYWRGELSIRRLSVLIHGLPADSLTARHYAGAPTGWDVQAYLLADLFHAFTGTPHPSRPKPQDAAKATRHARLLANLKAQRERAVTTTDP